MNSRGGSEKEETTKIAVFGLLYLFFTVACLFPFHGIPIANIAFGFPLGALIVRRFENLHYQAVFSGDANESMAQSKAAISQYYHQWLRDLVSWSLISSGVTMLICWAQLVGALMVVRYAEPGATVIDWIPLISADTLHSFRSRLFVMLISPGLQILTTAFGGIITLLLRRK